MATFDERAKEWDTPERVARAAEAVAAAIRANVDADAEQTASSTSAPGPGCSGWPWLDDIGELVLAEPSEGMREVIAEKLAAADLPQVKAIKLDLDGRSTAGRAVRPRRSRSSCCTTSRTRRPRWPRSVACCGPVAGSPSSDLDTEDGTFHSAEAEGIHHLGFDRAALGELARDAGFVDVEFRARRSRSRTRVGATRSSCCSAGTRDVVTTGTIAVSVEATPKKAFATAVDWPGWSRSGKTEELALAALQDYAPRYAVVAEEAGVPFDPGDYEVVERTEGAGGTDFGVPSSITDLDRRPVDAAEAERQARLVEAAWTVFARVAAGAPAELRKGPRGGGRDRDKMVGHVAESDGVLRPRDRDHRETAGPDGQSGDRGHARRDARHPPPPVGRLALAGRTWTARYAARRIAWHALDHAWEMEDRSDPA